MRKMKGLLGIIVGSFLLLHAGGNLAYADDHGNNGTLKVVSATDPGNDMDNDPKVCSFHLAGFKFDASSSGTWSITGQGGGAGAGTASGSWTANASGDWQTANMTLPDGQYKATAKQTSSATSGGDKQKVFKVSCVAAASPASEAPTNNAGEQAVTTTPAATTTTSPSPSPSAQGFVNVPNAQSNAQNNGQSNAQNMANAGQNANAQTGAGAQGFSNLPSTSTDSSGPLTALGALLVAFGAFLLRRPGRQTR